MRSDKTNVYPFFYIISVGDCNRSDGKRAVKIGISESKTPLQRLFTYHRHYGPGLKIHMLKVFKGVHIAKEERERSGFVTDYKNYENQIKYIFNNQFKANEPLERKRNINANEWFHFSDLPKMFELIDKFDQGNFNKNIDAYARRQSTRNYVLNQTARQEGRKETKAKTKIYTPAHRTMIMTENPNKKPQSTSTWRNRLKLIIDRTFNDVEGAIYNDAGKPKKYKLTDFIYDVERQYIIPKASMSGGNIFGRIMPYLYGGSKMGCPRGFDYDPIVFPECNNWV